MTSQWRSLNPEKCRWERILLHFPYVLLENLLSKKKPLPMLAGSSGVCLLRGRWGARADTPEGAPVPHGEAVPRRRRARIESRRENKRCLRLPLPVFLLDTVERSQMSLLCLSDRPRERLTRAWRQARLTGRVSRLTPRCHRTALPPENQLPQTQGGRGLRSNTAVLQRHEKVSDYLHVARSMSTSCLEQFLEKSFKKLVGRKVGNGLVCFLF